MTITVTGGDKWEILSKLGALRGDSNIRIRWRRQPKTGCIVDANGEETPRSFKSAAQAIKYIAELLNKHDSLVLDELRKEKEAKKMGLGL